jgi:hypothetical protein
MNSLKLIIALLAATVLMVFGAQNTQGRQPSFLGVQGGVYADGTRALCGCGARGALGMDRLSAGSLPRHA